MSSVTIGFVPRERFSTAAECLQRIFDCTHVPFNLIVVDCKMPDRYRKQVEDVIKDRSNVKVIQTEFFLHPAQSYNLVVQESRDDFICLMDMDTLVNEQWLFYLIAACEEHPADVAVPLIMERRGDFEEVHFDVRMGHIESVQQSDGVKLEIVPRRIPKEFDRSAKRRVTELIETHCMLFRREVFGRIGLFDEAAVSGRLMIDLSLALHQAKVPVVFEPKSGVTFLSPPPIHPEERDYYFFHHRLEQAIATEDYIKQKWNLSNFPSGINFVKRRRRLARD